MRDLHPRQLVILWIGVVLIESVLFFETLTVAAERMDPPFSIAVLHLLKFLHVPPTTVGLAVALGLLCVLLVALPLVMLVLTWKLLGGENAER